MTLMRFEPLREMDRLSEQLMGGPRVSRTMPMEALRRGDEFIVSLDVPGIHSDDIDVTVENNVVTVTAQRRPMREDGDQAVVDERPSGVFTRQLFLSDNLDASGLTANAENGVLTLRIPVAESSKPRKVEVGSQAEPQRIPTQQHAAT
ncbi:Hsp20/alpha crystallin family protein [Streptomonospora wellingtoniae]|uniref:Hsp20/alpha crystallin family protein n=1 Tax=Streptomonospora wellingtoniae TaxID=3075544 RepID=A0ABU2KPU7_9ACTN|nr:Hsp20/alpha crystallin family protein [Streptomonospora sp. DSM 45055]MDT0301299.1 Hsp20/alpha crystallin family protein [Streptomonospora sp. DSM 45055]